MSISKLAHVRILHAGSDTLSAPTTVYIAGAHICAAPVASETTAIDLPDSAILTPGWIDLGVHPGAPGREHCETYASLDHAATLGGFAQIALWPDNIPVADNQTGISYVVNNNRFRTRFLPIGAITKGCLGKEMAELYDMEAAGAIAFADGQQSIASSGVLQNVLTYAKPGGLKLMHHPHDNSLAPHGQMNEGIVSTALGLPGLPGLAEEIGVRRDIALVQYTGAALHLCGISTAGSVDLIRAAKAAGLPITASAYVANAIFNDTQLSEFDVNFKVLPPLRAQEDVLAVQAGLADGTLDALQSGHHPLDTESKAVEFSYAQAGMVGLSTALPLSFTYLLSILGLKRLVELWTSGPAKVLGIAVPTLEIDSPSGFTLIDPVAVWKFESKDLGSKSNNSPFLGVHFTGRAIVV